MLYIEQITYLLSTQLVQHVYTTMGNMSTQISNTHTLAVNTTAATSIHNSCNMSTQLWQSAHHNKPNNV